MKGLILLTFLSALLLFGCAMVSETTEEGAPGAPAEEGTEEETTEEETTEQETTEEEAVDLAGLDFAAIMALGIPVECDINYLYMGQPTSYKLYMDSQGASSIRVPLDESTSMGTNCSAMLIITKEDNAYMGCEGQKYYMSEVCDWLSVSIAEEGEDAGDMSQMSDPTEDFKEIPAADMDCRPWVYDASKFATPGKVCTMEEYSEELMAAYQ